MVKADFQQLLTIRFYPTMWLKLQAETLAVNRRVDTKIKNFGTLYGKSGLSAIADNPIPLCSKAQFFE